MDEIKPGLQADGGDIELVDVTDAGRVIVRLQGACHGCPGAWEVAIQGGGASAAFPETAYPLVASASVTPCANARHENARLEEFFQRLGKAVRLEERVKIARELERYLLIPWTNVREYSHRTYVKGVISPGPLPSNFLDHA